jgi:hypothetical protein
MRGTILAALLAALACAVGCEGLPQVREVDQGKVDRAMEQVEKGTE